MADHGYHQTALSLTGVFLLSLIVHVVLLTTLGGVVIFKYFKRPLVHDNSGRFRRIKSLVHPIVVK